MQEYKTRFEQSAWDTFLRFRTNLVQAGYGDTVETGQIAATLTQAAMTNSLDCEVGNVADAVLKLEGP